MIKRIASGLSLHTLATTLFSVVLAAIFALAIRDLWPGIRASHSPLGGSDAPGVNSALLARVPRSVTTLFGLPVGELPAETSPDGLELNLLGTLAVAGNPDQGFAILSTHQQSQLVSVGGNVGGSRLVSVYPDHVLLAREGHLIFLALPRSSTGGAGVLRGVDGAVPVYSGPPLVDPPVDEVKASVARATAPLSALLRAEPLLSDDVYRGLVVHPNGNSYLFGPGGLQGDDVITSVNGIGLTQERLNLLAEEMRTGRPVKVSLLRPGVGTLEVVLRPSSAFVAPGN